MKKILKHGKRVTAFLLAVILTATLLPTEYLGSMFPEKFVGNVKADTTLSNPRIEEDSSMAANQKVTWDCIWFGSYPQTEIHQSEQTYKALSELPESAWDNNNDTLQDGIKYRRLKGSDAICFISGSNNYYDWKSDYDSYHYFKYEPIKWRVIECNENKALLLSDFSLDNQEYNIENVNVVWEQCSLRSWLNGYTWNDKIDYFESSFINCAFDPNEQESILTTDLKNGSNIQYNTGNGNNTQDKLFLLSDEQSINETYGFAQNMDTCDEGRLCKSSDYTKAMGVYFNKDFCKWWLRTPGYDTIVATSINDNGSVDLYGENDYRKGNELGIRPALYINLSNIGSYSYAGTVSSDGVLIQDNETIDHTIGLNLEWGKDTFSFTNSVDSFALKKNKENNTYQYIMNTSLIDSSNFSPTDKEKMKDSISNFSGACFGMSVFTWKNYVEKIKLDNYQSGFGEESKIPSCLYDLDAPVDNQALQNILGFYSASSMTSKYQDVRDDFLHLEEKEKIKILYKKLKNIELTGTPVLVDYKWVADENAANKEEKDAWGAHAVLAYALETENAPYIYNGKEYAYRVRVINPNVLYSRNLSLDEANKSCIYITKDLDCCFIPESFVTADETGENELTSIQNYDGIVYKKGDMIIQNLVDDENLFPPKESGKNTMKDFLFTNKTKIKLNGNVVNGNLIKGAYLRSVALSAGGQSGLLTLTMEKNAPAQIEILCEDQYVGYDCGDQYIHVSANKGSKAQLKNGNIQLTNSSGDYEIKLVSNKNLPNVNTNKLIIQGTGGQVIGISLMNDNIILTGSDLKGTKITTGYGDFAIIEDDLKEVKLNNNNGKLSYNEEVLSKKNEIVISKLIVSGLSHNIARGKKIKLIASVIPTNSSNQKLIWSSSNPKVAAVTQTGIVSLKKNTGGKTVTITATATDGSGISASWKIKSMKGVVKKVSVSGVKTVKAGKSLKLKAKVTATKGANKKLKWTSSNTKYATVTSTGKVKTFKAGKGKKVKITAMATDGSNKKKTVTIKIK